jgi:hypothetical protein
LFILAAACAGALAAAAPAGLRIPAHFEKNQGQLPEHVRYLARLGQHAVLLTGTEAVVPVTKEREVRIAFRNGNPAPRTEALQARVATTNYLVGGRSGWKTGIGQYSRVRYYDVYPGIDVDYYLAGDRLEFDFVVKPGADPDQIRLQFGGADRVTTTATGDLAIEAGGQTIRQLRPVVYQEVPGTGERRSIEGAYEVSTRNEVRFRLGGYDPEQSLVIDPVLVYSTYFGGVNPEIGSVIAVDQSGKLWVAGNTASEGLPVRGEPYKDAKAGGQDVFLARFNPAVRGEESLEMLTYLGGTGFDEVRAIDISPSGYIVLAGTTASTDFPTAGNAPRREAVGDRDIFVTLVNPFERGEFLVSFSTYLGGAGLDVANAVAMDRADNIYVTGYTTSEDFPLTGNRYQPNRRGGYEAFVSKLAPGLPDSQSLVYSTYYGSGSTDVGMAIAVDDAGMIYFAGYSLGDTPTSDIPPYSAFPAGRGDGFIAKLDPTKGFPDALIYGGFIGGSDFDKLFSLKLDRTGGVILAGYTDSDDFPVTASAFQRERSGDSDLFVMRMDLTRPPAQQITYSTLLGGTDTDILYGAALDGLNRVVVTGYTLSENFPAKGSSFQGQFNGAIDAFVAWIDPAASGAASLVASTLLGGADIDAGYGVAADARGRAFVTGFSVSSNLPVTEGAWNQSNVGIADAFITAIDF